MLFWFHLNTGLQTAGQGLRDLVKKLRNPFLNPGLLLGKTLQRWRQSNDLPQLTLKLDGFVHPTLERSAKHLEYCVHRFQYIVEIMLQRYGADITNRQLVLKRMADIAIDIYAMTAVLSRSSRSYCTGIRNAQAEVGN